MGEGLSSLSTIDSLPPAVQTAIRDAYQQGSRWSFISLIPWAALAFIVTLFLSKIPDTDREGVQGEGVQAKDTHEMTQYNESDPVATDTQQLPNPSALPEV